MKFSCAPMSTWGNRLLFVLVIASSMLSGCASFYVDSAVKEIPPSEFRQVADPKPVQVLFEFQTKGVANSRATALLKGQITDQIKASGLFTSVEEKPVPTGGILSIKLNNVPISDDAFSKGFVTGLTFGLAGNQVSDGYVCTMEYLSAGSGETIRKQARHAIHTVIGAKSAPENGVPAANVEAAVRMMARQVVSTTLKDLSEDPVFQ